MDESISRWAPLTDIARFSNNAFRSTLGSIVLCKGVYDLAHLGHVVSLWSASELGDTLVVAIATDRSVKERKGPSRPVLSFRERAGVVGSLKMVDYIVAYDDVSPLSVIETVRPHIFCATHDKMFLPHQLTRLAELGVNFQILPRPTERSTTEIIEEIQSEFTDR